MSSEETSNGCFFFKFICAPPLQSLLLNFIFSSVDSSDIAKEREELMELAENIKAGVKVNTYVL